MPLMRRFARRCRQIVTADCPSCAETPATFYLKNIGRNEATVHSVSVPDGWELSMGSGAFSVRPGDALRVSLRRRPATAKDAETSGGLRRGGLEHVLVHTDDPVRPTRYIALAMDPLPPLSTSVRSIDFGEGPRSQVLSRKRTLIVQMARELGDVYVEPSEPWLMATLVHDQVVKTLSWRDGVVRAEIALTGNQSSAIGTGLAQAELLVCGTAPDAETDLHTLRLPVWMRIWPDVRAHPREVFLGIAPAATTVEKCVEIRSDIGPVPPLTIHPGGGGAAGIEASVRQRDSGGPATLCVHVDSARLAPGPHEGAIVVQCAPGRPDEVTVTIPFYVYVVHRNGCPAGERGKPLPGSSTHKEAKG